jgi:hypothetical protein
MLSRKFGVAANFNQLSPRGGASHADAHAFEKPLDRLPALAGELGLQIVEAGSEGSLPIGIESFRLL